MADERCFDQRHAGMGHDSHCDDETSSRASVIQQRRASISRSAAAEDVRRALADRDGGSETCGDGEESWEATGNLIGNPPVRDRHCPPNTDVVEDEATYHQRRNAAQTAHQNQKARADGWLSRDQKSVEDNRYWFARVYQYVTDGELKEAENATFYYPSYVLQCVRYFEQIYADNVDAADAVGGKAEDHWRVAFEKCGRRGDVTEKDIGLLHAASLTPGSVLGLGSPLLAMAVAEVYGAVQALVASMLAHIRFDLPRAEAWVFESHYQGQGSASLRDFQADFNSMTDIFDRAAERMNTEMADKMGLPVDLMPRVLQDLAMDKWFDANMVTERAHTWMRAEALVDEDKAGPDPYVDTGTSLVGDATRGDNTSGLSELDNTKLRPSMEASSDVIDDDGAREKSKRDDLVSTSSNERIVLLRALLSGVTGNADEDAALRILRASVTSGDLVTVVDGANAWDLLADTHGDQVAPLRALLRRHYYPHTSASMALNLIRRCMDGVTAEWEEEMVADLLVDRGDGRELLTQIGRIYEEGGFEEGLDEVRWQLDGDDQDRVDAVFGD